MKSQAINLAFLVLAVLAFLGLVSKKPAISAIFLFIQSVIINIILATVYGLSSPVLSASVLLSFFSMITIGTSYYFEISFKSAPVKSSKLNIIIGVALFLVFLKNIDSFVIEKSSIIITRLSLGINYTFIIMVGFAIFSILVCALTILDMKHPKSGDSR